MKKFILACLLLSILSFNSFSQNSKNVVSISATKFNVLYVGVDNPLTIAVSDYSPDKITVSINNSCTITDSKNGEYIVKAMKPGTATITVKSSETNNVLGTMDFKVKKIPDPIAHIGNINKKDNKITNEALISAGGITLTLEDFNFDVKFEIVSFDMITVGKTKPEIKTATGSQFSNDMIKKIKKLKSEEKINFENIKVKCPDGEIRKVNNLKFEII
ncbi:MAG: GldM family protein [Bacteroidota bacterium]|nr:GldM family protein [Bacteroidota bacterium]